MKELLVHKELQKKLQQTLNKDNHEDDDELDIDELDRHTESGGSSDIDDDESEALTDAVSRNLAQVHGEDSDDEKRKDKVKDHHQREMEVERKLKFKRE